MTGETRALVLSAAAALVLGVLALVVALATGSGAILLDGVFNLCFFVTALVTLRVARLLERPDDQQYPFGYLHSSP
jgi:predicted Co/Zn/Cd cation transporter (cation efflux family)